MTAPAPISSWYKPEFPPDSADHTCYCRQQAYGRTVFWVGGDRVYRWHCREHLPAEPVIHRAVAS